MSDSRRIVGFVGLLVFAGAAILLDWHVAWAIVAFICAVLTL